MNFGIHPISGTNLPTTTTSNSTVSNMFTQRGDVLTFDGDALRRLGLGSDGQFLSVDKTSETGLNWVSGSAEKLKALDTYLYNYELNKEPTILRQSDFNGGTYRIRNSGVYKLGEDISFNPNPNNDHLPTPQQASLYPVQPLGPYHLGFFAALSIEADNVIVNLNGFNLSQSRAHKLQQRFFACIELGSAPFVPKQGPSNFGDVVVYPRKVKVYNGSLGGTSHHCLHGLSVDGAVISDILFKDFQLNGWHLNGARNCILRNLHCKNNDKDVKVLATYSQARLIRSFLQATISAHSNPSMLIKGVNKSGTQIKSELESVMANVYNVVVNNAGTYSTAAQDLFVNPNVGLDGGSTYGGVLNTFGIAVDNFIQDRSSLEGGNENIRLENITIENITSTPMEVIALSSEVNIPKYGMNLQKGPVGDVFRILNVTNNDGSYKPNVLANAQLYIAKFGVGPEQRGGTSIDSDVVTWASGSATSIGGTHYYMCAGDSMAHNIKGNIGLFISGGTDIECDNVIVKNLENGGDVGEKDKQGGVDCANEDVVYDGNHIRGIAIVSCKNVKFTNFKTPTGIKSKTGSAIPVDLIGENINISFN